MAISEIDNLRTRLTSTGVVGGVNKRFLQQQNINETKVLGKQIAESQAILAQERERRQKETIKRYLASKNEALKNAGNDQFSAFFNPATGGNNGVGPFEAGLLTTRGLGAPTLGLLTSSAGAEVVDKLRASGGVVGLPSYFSDEQVREFQSRLPQGLRAVRTGGQVATDVGFKEGKFVVPLPVKPTAEQTALKQRFKPNVSFDVSGKPTSIGTTKNLEARMKLLNVKKGTGSITDLSSMMQTEVINQVIGYGRRSTPLFDTILKKAAEKGITEDLINYLAKKVIA